MNKDIRGFEGLYTIDEDGNVFSLKSNKYLAQNNVKGYFQVCLFKDGIRHYRKIHRLVAEAFVPNPSCLSCVNHIDEDKSNNNYLNLEWCDVAYNNSYGTRLTRVGDSIGRKVCQYSLDGKFIKEWTTIRKASLSTHIAHTDIGRVARGERKSAGGFIWRYANE